MLLNCGRIAQSRRGAEKRGPARGAGSRISSKCADVVGCADKEKSQKSGKHRVAKLT